MEVAVGAEDAVAGLNTILGLAPGETLNANIQTSMGDLDCALRPDKAPVTVANFVGLSRGSIKWTDPNTETVGEGSLYDGTILHRVYG